MAPQDLQAGHDDALEKRTNGSTLRALYDLFVDVPHPHASSSCPPASVIGESAAGSSFLGSNNGGKTTQQHQQKPLFDRDALESTLKEISLFSFPEYEHETNAFDAFSNEMNKYDQYIMKAPAVKNFTFSFIIQDSSSSSIQKNSTSPSGGTRVYGHVRRYFPIHRNAANRYDVGRRGQRALVILTRTQGADIFFSSILKTVEALQSQQQTLPFPEILPHKDPVQFFLDQLNSKHQQLSYDYDNELLEQGGAPVNLSIEGIEFGTATDLYTSADRCSFRLPTSLLTNGKFCSSSFSIVLPLLRCLGVPNTLRLMSALLSEGQVLFVSSNPTRLSTCARSAISILGQGLLQWPHTYYPILPPHLIDQIESTEPFLVGLLAQFVPKVRQMDNLGSDLLLINLDQSIIETSYEINGDPDELEAPMPHLLRSFSGGFAGQIGGPITPFSAYEILVQDLVALLKEDKSTVFKDPTTLASVGDRAMKATKAVKRSLKRRLSWFTSNKDKTSQYNESVGNFPGVEHFSDTEADDDFLDDLSECTEANDKTNQALIDNAEKEKEKEKYNNDGDHSLADMVYPWDCQNEVGEEKAQVAFASFFLCMYGNSNWYLSFVDNDAPPVIDGEKFLKHKRALSDGEGTPMWPLLRSFVRTKMFKNLAQQRIDEIIQQQSASEGAALQDTICFLPDAPIFMQCVYYHKQHDIDFGIHSVRRVAGQIAQNNRIHETFRSSARIDTMILTTSKKYVELPNGVQSYTKAVFDLVGQCRMSNSALLDVVSVIWLRLRYSKGLHWQHGYKALCILKELLCNGPLEAIAETIDLLEKIHVMKKYDDNFVWQNCHQIRTIAREVYSLLVDRAKLFTLRRACANERRILYIGNPQQAIKSRDERIKVTVPFKHLHMAFHPTDKVVLPAPAELQKSIDGQTDKNKKTGGDSDASMDSQAILALYEQTLEQQKALQNLKNLPGFYVLLAGVLHAFIAAQVEGSKSGRGVMFILFGLISSTRQTIERREKSKTAINEILAGVFMLLLVVVFWPQEQRQKKLTNTTK